MSGGGGKGGSQTTEMSIPGYLEDAAKGNLNRADDISQIGYTPYIGADVAAFTPQQNAAFAGANQAASAFGLPATAGTGMPEPQQFAGGISGYSSAPLYNESLAALQTQAPGQYNAITGMFIDPVTGQMSRGGQPQQQPMAQQQPINNPHWNFLMSSPEIKSIYGGGN